MKIKVQSIIYLLNHWNIAALMCFLQEGITYEEEITACIH